MSSEKASHIHARCEAALKSVFRLLWNHKVSVLNPQSQVNNDAAVFDDDIQSESSRPLSEDGLRSQYRIFCFCSLNQTLE